MTDRMRQFVVTVTAWLWGLQAGLGLAGLFDAAVPDGVLMILGAVALIGTLAVAERQQWQQATYWVASRRRP